MIFVTTFAYALGWRLGIEQAADEFRRQLDQPDNESLPVVRTIARLRRLDEVCLWLDSGATRLAESRSRGLHEAWKSSADIWFTCDDDCEATLETLNWMLEAVRDRPAVCIAPYWARLSQLQEERINLSVPPPPEGCERIYRELSGEGKTTAATYGGLGLVAASRQAVQRFMEHNADFTYTDLEGETRVASCLEYIKDGFWLGEDLAFFSRIPPDVSIETLVTGTTMHNGRSLDLGLLVLGALQLEQHATHHPVTTRN
jgi:hypothetical protein